jgi:hypothetical protein
VFMMCANMVSAMRMVRLPAAPAALLAPRLQHLRALVLPTHPRACGVGGWRGGTAMRALHAASHTALRRTPLGARATGEEKRGAPVLGRPALGAGSGRSWRWNGESKRGYNYNYGGGLDDTTTIVRLSMVHGWMRVGDELLVVLGVCIACGA